MMQSNMYPEEKCTSNFNYFCQVPVAPTCNPSYTRDRDQKDHGSKPAKSNSLQILKKPITKKRLVEWLEV
jgi:hypothetical protein